MMSPPTVQRHLNKDKCSDLLTFTFEGANDYDKNKPLYIDAEDPERYLTAFQTKCLVQKIIAGLKSIGVGKGQHVAVHLQNTFLYPAIFFGIVGAGAIYTASNPAYKSFELDHLFNLARPTVIITSPDLLPLVEEVALSRGQSKGSIYVVEPDTFDIKRFANTSGSSMEPNGISNGVEHVSRFESLLAHGLCDWLRISDEATARSWMGVAFTTSGTTGLPKLAVMSHYGLVASIEYFLRPTPYKVIRLLTLPFFLIYGFVVGQVPALRLGEPLYVLKRFHINEFARAIPKYKITDACMTPLIVSALLKSDMDLKSLFSTLRLVLIGGGQLASAVQQDFSQYLDETACIAHGWGMTETGVVTIFRYGDAAVDTVDSVGYLVDGPELKLLDENGALVLSDNTPGEAFVRSKAMLSYYVTSTTRSLSPLDSDGWMRTGDILYRVGSRYFFVARSKDLIKVKGWQVAPAEIETVLLTNPAIAECAVVGITMEDGVTEKIRAFVVRRPGVKLTANEVYDYTRSRLAGYKALDGGVVFIESIPRTAMGKPQKYKLPDLKHIAELPEKARNVIVHSAEMIAATGI